MWSGASALLTDGIRRLTRAPRSALWLMRTTHLEPLPGTWRAGAGVAVAVVGLGQLLTLVSVSDQIRTIAGVLAAAFVLLPRRSGRLVGPPEDWALDGDPGRATAAGGRWMAALSLPVAVLWAAGSLSDPRWADADLTTTLLHAVVIILGVACFEEVIFRGLLLRWCSSGLSTPAGVAISSVAFGLWHIAPEHERSGWGIVLVLVVIGTTLAGVFLCWLRLGTRSLIAPTMVHAGVNLAAFLAVVTAV
jgi:membrane protease YdiL (CAAX protease family)